MNYENCSYNFRSKTIIKLMLLLLFWGTLPCLKFNDIVSCYLRTLTFNSVFDIQNENSGNYSNFKYNISNIISYHWTLGTTRIY